MIITQLWAAVIVDGSSMPSHCDGRASQLVPQAAHTSTTFPVGPAPSLGQICAGRVTSSSIPSPRFPCSFHPQPQTLLDIPFPMSIDGEVNTSTCSLPHASLMIWVVGSMGSFTMPIVFELDTAELVLPSCPFALLPVASRRSCIPSRVWTYVPFHVHPILSMGICSNERPSSWSFLLEPSTDMRLDSCKTTVCSFPSAQQRIGSLATSMGISAGRLMTAAFVFWPN